VQSAYSCLFQYAEFKPSRSRHLRHPSFNFQAVIKHGFSALHMAALNGHTGIVRLLLDAGVPADYVPGQRLWLSTIRHPVVHTPVCLRGAIVSAFIITSAADWCGWLAVLWRISCMLCRPTLPRYTTVAGRYARSRWHMSVASGTRSRQELCRQVRQIHCEGGNGREED